MRARLRINHYVNRKDLKISMYVKRFIQLFVIFLVTIFISMIFVTCFNIQGYLAQSLVLSGIGYILLVLPLTVLTIMKQRKKFSTPQNEQNGSAFQNALSTLDNILVLSTVSSDNVVSSSVITFKQSHTNENVLYVVTGKDTLRVKNIKQNHVASIATWYDQKTGTRVSSNAVSAIAISEQDVNATLATHPEIKSLSDNFSKNVIIKLTLHSALVESFQSSPVVVDFS